MSLGLPPDQGNRGLVLQNRFLDSRGEIAPSSHGSVVDRGQTKIDPTFSSLTEGQQLILNLNLILLCH